MELKPLGETGVMVPEIGLGVWKYRGGVEPLRRGIELGAFFIDTAEMYRTEDAVGQAVKNIRDRVFIATKVSGGHLHHDDVLRAAEASLRQLQTDSIDLYQVHWPNSNPMQQPLSPIFLGAHDPKYALKRAARFADGWFPANLPPEKFREAIPEIKRLAKEAGRDPEKLEFSVLMMAQGDGPSLDTMKQYQEAGVSRMIVLAWAAASGSGVEAVKGLSSIVERTQRV